MVSMQNTASPRECVRGFTLIEMVAVMAITLVLIALAAPGFRDLMRSQTIKNTSFNLVSSLVRARSEAVTRNADVTVQPVNGSWLNGWVIALADGTQISKSDAPSIAYATVYPLAMLLRIVAAQTLVFVLCR